MSSFQSYSTKAIVGLAVFIGGLPLLLRAFCHWPLAEWLLGVQLQFSIVSLVVLASSLLTRSKVAICLSLLAAVLNLWLVLPIYLPASNTAQSLSDPIKLLSFNVLHQNEQFESAIEFVLDEDPDIAVFQEVTAPWPEELAVLRKHFQYHHRADKIQIEVFSKLPIEKIELDLVGEYRGSVVWETVWDKQRINVIASHCYPQRYYGQQGFDWRNEQLTERIPALAKRSNSPTLLLGDLNATSWTPYFSTMLEKSGLKNARQGFGVFPSCGKTAFGALFCVPYDQCLVSDHWQVQDFRTGPFLGSDHFPIVVELRVGH